MGDVYIKPDKVVVEPEAVFIYKNGRLMASYEIGQHQRFDGVQYYGELIKEDSDD